MNWTIDFAPMIPTPLFWAAMVVVALLVGLLLLRRMRGATLRALALASLLTALANPTLRQEERESLANIAIVVVDESASQTLGGRPEQTAAIKSDLEAKLKAIPGLQTKWVASSRPAGETSGTNLFADLNRALANVPTDRLAGVIMITEGQVHDVPKSAAALGFDAPVHALLTGRPDEFDRRIEIIKLPRYGIVTQEREACNHRPGRGTFMTKAKPKEAPRADREIRFRIVEEGRRSSPGTRVQIRIRRDGKSDEIRRVAIGEIVTTEMEFRHSGANIVEIELEGAPGELTLANNRAAVIAEGVRENLRVLLVSGEPHAGERTWRNLLRSDAAVDLIHFTILRPPEKQDGTPIHELSLIPFPTRELFSEKINEFDLIIFDRYKHNGILQLLYYDNIAQYVEKCGGALLMAAGDDYAGRQSLYSTLLKPVLPAAPTGVVIEQPFRAKTTKVGNRHPVTMGLPGASMTEPTWGRWLRQVEAKVLRGQTVLSGVDERPLLILDRTGKGRVALMLSDHAWLWARGYDGGGPHTDLLRRTAHWLMKEPDLEEERLTAASKGFAITVERRSMSDATPTVSMSAPAGGDKTALKLDKVSEGLWRTTFDVKVPGLYKFESGELAAVTHAGIEDAREMSEVVATEAKLRPIADATGGGLFWTRGAGLLASTSSTAVDVPRVTMLASARHLAGSGWLGLKDREAFVTRGVKLTPMFTGLIALSALIFLIALAWWREGR